ncbi:hypothetical protein KAFR_0H01550 [Kazachstania africana CBS 2517]|uniref:ATP-dependent RNA helicase SUV3, mitochondrial n=1 Tax=Kazachstania africana (strain ATCC 22294 / BCRC 22015 / CBS 2517 / CECT 1963 / NBRC 1671 / NRRL Y-8276) TaxID=1071382 RepID=H2AZ09_KAZAF|nr:hypothetical protein KAFR_0H01550 [Kazachstania africana CBS 2517]CCF59565.1 hypothetical protein KAFR_0H01550 [Kazachstania africana CBS 2517]
MIHRLLSRYRFPITPYGVCSKTIQQNSIASNFCKRNDTASKALYSTSYVSSRRTAKLNTCKIHVQNENIPQTFRETQNFELLLNTALREVHNKYVFLKSSDRNEYHLKQLTWDSLCSSIQKQLDDKELPLKIKNFPVRLSEYIQPLDDSKIILQLLNIDKISHKAWQVLLKEQSPTIERKFQYLFLKLLSYNHEKKTLPSAVQASESISITDPIDWFPETRKIRRHIIMHLGPTNSGKTYRALKRLGEVDRGYYGGPLRLLAREVYDRFKSEGTRCNLLTGEEVINDLDEHGEKAGLTSGTVEMIPYSQDFDVVVLDEIQMLGDEDRGWAWSNALLGVKAKEIHLCGEKSVLPVIKKITALTGDKLTINEYERLGELSVESRSLKNGNMRNLRKGDCLVAFSKKKILDLKLKIERETKFKVAVIYGSLPPETRLQQASLFNNGEYEILVASDAIGMGLNLAIDRIIFMTDVKFNGKELVNLTASNIRQIGGRAGRYKDTKDEPSKGFITATKSSVLKSIRDGMEAPMSYLDKIVVWPTDEICAKLMVRYPPRTKLSFLLKKFEEQLENHSKQLFKLPDLESKLKTIDLFERMNTIPFHEKLRLSTAPVKDAPLVKDAFKQFCETISERYTKSLLSYDFPFHTLDYSYIQNERYDLEHYESLYNIITLFFWLSNRYPAYFIDTESAKDLRNFCELIIFEKLDRLKKNPYQRGVSLPYRDTFHSKPDFRRALTKPTPAYRQHNAYIAR